MSLLHAMSGFFPGTPYTQEAGVPIVRGETREPGLAAGTARIQWDIRAISGADDFREEAPSEAQVLTPTKGEKEALTKSQKTAILRRPENETFTKELQGLFNTAVKNIEEIAGKQKSTLANTCDRLRREIAEAKYPYDEVAADTREAEAAGVTAIISTYRAYQDLQKLSSAQVEVVAGCKAAKEAITKIDDKLVNIQHAAEAAVNIAHDEMKKELDSMAFDFNSLLERALLRRKIQE
ncbi:g6106 [Coccomyxa elongata]